MDTDKMVILSALEITELPMSDNSKPSVEECEYHVRYAETDAMGVVHHATYLVYFEEGRSQYMRSRGLDYAELEAAGFRLPVTEVGLRYVGSLRYGQKVKIRTWIEEDRSRRLRFAYEVLDPDSGKSLVTGFTEHVWTNSEGRVQRAPEHWQAFQANSA